MSTITTPIKIFYSHRRQKILQNKNADSPPSQKIVFAKTVLSFSGR